MSEDPRKLDHQQRILDFMVRQKILNFSPMPEKRLEDDVQKLLRLLTFRGYLDRSSTFERLYFEGLLRALVLDLGTPHPEQSVTTFTVRQYGNELGYSADFKFCFMLHHQDKKLTLENMAIMKGEITNKIISFMSEVGLPDITSLDLSLSPANERRKPVGPKEKKKGKGGLGSKGL